MTAHRTYSCNLCGVNAQNSGNAALFGIHWPAGQRIEIRGNVTVENHLCRGCIQAIKALNIPPEAPDVY